MALSEITADAVLAAVQEHDRVGRDGFLQQHGFGEASRYFLDLNGRRYDSKAIVGYAHGVARPDFGALTHNDFTGGLATVVALLRRLNFNVVDIDGQTVEAPPRNPAWTRDELILALDFYMTWRNAIPDKTSAEIAELSCQVNAVALRLGFADSGTLRNTNGVYMKLMNFRSHDPGYTSGGKTGLSRGNRDEKVLWNIYSADRERLREAAEAILASLNARPVDALDDVDEPEIAEAEEGRLLTRVHRTRERNRKIVRDKKANFLKQHGRLFCEACGFDFAAVYGERGDGIIECHHTTPLHTLSDARKTRLSDLALLCANCHRVLHAKQPWLTLEKLRDLATRSK